MGGRDRRERRDRSAHSAGLVTLACLAANAVLFAHNELVRSELPARARPPRFILSRLDALAGGLSASSSSGSERSYSPRVMELIMRLHKVVARRVASQQQQRVYRVQRSRADYRVTVADALDTLGLRVTNESDSWEFDIYWGNQLTDHAAFLDPRLAPHMLVSSVLGLMAETLGDKDFLGHALQLCAAQHGHAACDFVPPIYAMPHQAARWREAFKQHRFWIRKDKKVWGSAGVSILSSAKQLPPDGTSYLLQEYVATPLLWLGFKHDLRLWAVLTSVRPLRLYLLQDGWARVMQRHHRPRPLRISEEIAERISEEIADLGGDCGSRRRALQRSQLGGAHFAPSARPARAVWRCAAPTASPAERALPSFCVRGCACALQVAARQYDADGLDANLADACMHLTATYCTEAPDDSLRLLRTNLAKYRQGLGKTGARAGHGGTFDFGSELWPAIERAVLRTVLFAAPLLEGCGACTRRRPRPLLGPALLHGPPAIDRAALARVLAIAGTTRC